MLIASAKVGRCLALAACKVGLDAIPSSSWFCCAALPAKFLSPERGRQIVAWRREPQVRTISHQRAFLLDARLPQPAKRAAGSSPRTATPEAPQVSLLFPGCRPVPGLGPNPWSGPLLTYRRPGADATRLRSAAASAAVAGRRHDRGSLANLAHQDQRGPSRRIGPIKPDFAPREPRPLRIVTSRS